MSKNRVIARAAGLSSWAGLALLSACAADDRGLAELEGRIGPDVRIESGLALARLNCASCHAVQAEGDSPRPMAPPFPWLAGRLTGPKLEESLTMVSDLGHGEMPPVRLEQAELRDLAAYIDSLD